jgi:hypothetical protein
MKKIIYLFAFCFLLSNFYLNAQYSIPNASFENWTPKTSPAYGPYFEFETDLFYTLNSLYDLKNDAGASDLTAFRDNNIVQHGNYSIRLTSGRVAGGTGWVFLPGMVGTVSQDFVNEFLDPGNLDGVKISKLWEYDTPHALEGYFQYKPVDGDSALIDIGFYDYDGLAFPPVTKIIKGTVDTWTKFSLDVPEKYWNEEFHEIRILFVASAGVNFVHLDECVGQLGSTLWVDNLSLNYKEVGISQNLFSTLKANAFPNPATDALNIELNENFTGKISVYNISGGKVMEDVINGTQCQINTSALASGNYIYKLMNENTIFAQGKFVVTK